jgi:hypothetical protein
MAAPHRIKMPTRDACNGAARRESMRKMTKKEQAAILKERKALDKVATLDYIHELAQLEDLHRCWDRYLALVGTFEAMERGAAKAVLAFIEELVKDPAYALEWGDKSAQHAADQKIAQIILGHLQNDGPEVALRVATYNTLKGARYPQRSTLMLSNLMHQNRLAAWAEAQEKLQFWMDYGI